MHLTATLERASRITPDKDAIVYGEETLSYRDLLDGARRAAGALIERGVSPGDRVAVMTFNTPGFAIAAFGIWFAGGVLVPVNHKLAMPEARYAVEHSGAAVGIVAAELAPIAVEAAPGIPWLSTEAQVEGLEFFDSVVERSTPVEGAVDDDLDAPAQFLFTSGTTSFPKACVHTHRTIGAASPLMAATIGFTAEDRFLIAMPIWHAAPLNCWFLTMIFLGATVVLQREYHPVQMLQNIQRHRVTAFFGAPIAYTMPVQLHEAGRLDLAGFDLSSMRAWIYGGAPLGREVAAQLTAAYGTDRFFQVYGMSEMGPTGTALYPHEQLEKAGSIGRGGHPGVDLRVVDLDGRDAGAGGTGEIWLRADSRMAGYHRNDEATREAFAGPWFRTGDVARIDEDGYLFIVDRLKDIVIVGGENVHSQEVEEALRGHPRIADVAVVGRPEPQWGEVVVAVYVSADGEDVTAEDMQGFLDGRIARYKRPRETLRLEELPRNPSGKLTKHVLRARLRHDGAS